MKSRKPRIALDIGATDGCCSIICDMYGEGLVHGSPNAPTRVPSARGEDGRPKDHRRVLGRVGEDIALAHLQDRGFLLIDRNYLTRRGEIDLIVFDGCTLVFVEVKTQRMEASGTVAPESPLKWLTARQQARKRPLAMMWLYDGKHARRPRAQSIRFDAIGVLVDACDAAVLVDHVEGVV